MEGLCLLSQYDDFKEDNAEGERRLISFVVHSMIKSKIDSCLL